MKTFRRSLKYLGKYRWLAIGAFITMNIVTLCSLIVPQYIQQIIDDGITPKNLDVIKTVSFSLIAITVFRAISSFCSTYWSQKASQGIAYDIRNDMYRKLEYLEFSFHDRHNIGQLLTRTTNDVEGMRTFFAQGLLQMISAIITLAGSVIILLTTNAKLFLWVSLILPFIILVFAYIFRKLTPLFGIIQKNLGVLNNILQENILGIRIVKGFTAEDLEHEKYERQNQEIYDLNIKLINTFSNGFPVVFFLSNVATLIVLWVGGTQVINEEMSIGTLIAFNSYLTFLVQPIFQMGFVLQQFARSNASADRIFSILDNENSIVSPDHPSELKLGPASDIVFENVSFSYTDTDDQLILKDINLRIKKGSNTAIIGATGSGKSSLVNLIPRFYDPDSGSVKIGGVDLRELDLDELRKNIGVVLQEIRLINSSVRENIRYGKPEATDDEIMEVCHIAQVDNFLPKLDGGLDFEVGEGGQNLSGGQRQRVAIARMLLVEPNILILDDATSALDAETESELISDAAEYLDSDEYTVIVISQKVNSVKQADHIVLMDEGRITDQGTHDQLLRCSENYRKLVYEQEPEPVSG